MTLATSRANIRLVYISHYLSQYLLEIYYIPRKTNIVPDTLSRLAINKLRNISQDNILNNIWLTFKVFIKNKFKDHFRKGYLANAHFKRYLCFLGLRKDNKMPQINKKHSILFIIKDGLLYNIAKDRLQRLYIPNIVLNNVL
jgi:hypothetical protein